MLHVPVVATAMPQAVLRAHCATGGPMELLVDEVCALCVQLGGEHSGGVLCSVRHVQQDSTLTLSIAFSA